MRACTHVHSPWCMHTHTGGHAHACKVLTQSSYAQVKKPRFNPFKDKEYKKQALARMRLRFAEAKKNKPRKRRMTERQKRALEARDEATRGIGRPAAQRRPRKRKNADDSEDRTRRGRAASSGRKGRSHE